MIHINVLTDNEIIRNKSVHHIVKADLVLLLDSIVNRLEEIIASRRVESWCGSVFDLSDQTYDVSVEEGTCVKNGELFLYILYLFISEFFHIRVRARVDVFLVIR